MGVLKKIPFRVWMFGFSAVLIGLDQLFKYLAVIYLKDQVTFPLIQDVLHLTFVKNEGAAFNIMDGQQLLLVLLTAILLIAVFVALVIGWSGKKVVLFSLALILGGGIGNLIDRIINGYVVDYLDFRLIGFAVFNFADSCVVIGVAVLTIYILFFDRRKKETVLAESSEEE